MSPLRVKKYKGDSDDEDDGGSQSLNNLNDDEMPEVKAH